MNRFASDLRLSLSPQALAISLRPYEPRGVDGRPRGTNCRHAMPSRSCRIDLESKGADGCGRRSSSAPSLTPRLFSAHEDQH
jgi:hypothetical protein